jgi:alkaline phosphatase D
MKRINFFFLIAALLLNSLVVQGYKSELTNLMSLIAEGKIDESIQQTNQFLEQHPDDPEAYYILAVAYTRKGKINKAMDYVRASIQNGLPFSRYLAGPRELLKPLTSSTRFKKWHKQNGTQLIHGPMLSDVTSTSAEFWVRTYQEVPVKVIMHAFDSKDTLRSEAANTSASDDYTANIRMDGLQPNTEYKYNVIVDGKMQSQRHVFHTYPEKGKPVNLQIGFGGGAGFNPIYRQMWTTLSSHWFPAFLFLGDNVYIDHPKQPAVQDYVYYRRQSVPRYKNFISRTAIYSIWDDHDFGTNDSWGTAAVDSPAWKIPVWEKYKNNWNNPYYAGGKDQPGVWFNFSIGDVEFFMLDCRYYRTSPIAENKHMLGKAQREWLFEKLEASDATFKVIVSSVPWSYNTKKGTRTINGKEVSRAYDTWHGFKDEREKVFSFIEEEKIEGVVLLSADRHRSEAWQIERLKGYDFYEFESSKLTNRHTHWVMPESIFGYNEKCSFGLLEFNTTKKDPELTFKIVSIDNEIINTITVRRSQLEFDNLRFRGEVNW